MQSKTLAMIPAKLDSERLKRKNLALLHGHPLIYYAIEAAKESGVFDDIVVNADHIVFKEIAQRYHVSFYQRPPHLGLARTKSDEVVKDFLENNPCDTLAWVNAIAPLQTGKVIQNVVRYFFDQGLDSLITTKSEQVHCVYENKPVNFQREGRFARTQDLEPVQAFIYSIMMWKSQTFLDTYKRNGYALLCGRVGYYALDKLNSIIVKNKNDLQLAEIILEITQNKSNYEVTYDRVLDSIE